MKPLLIRADANPSVGYGHIMRCLALAQEWQSRGGLVMFASVLLPVPLKNRLENAGFAIKSLNAERGSVEDANQTGDIVEELGCDWVVIDDYAFRSKFQKTIKDRCHKLLVIDDGRHADKYFADIIVNQNLFATADFYPSQCLCSFTKLLLGPRYVLIRNEFILKQTRNYSESGRRFKVLVTLGGADPENITQKVIDGLRIYSGHKLNVIIVTSAANVHLNSLKQSITDSTGFHQFDLVTDVDEMPELMNSVDVAISAGGITCWELAYMGVPSTIITLSANQSRNGIELAKANIGINLGSRNDFTAEILATTLLTLLKDHEKRKLMAENGHRLIDGSGSCRVASEMLSMTENGIL